MRIILLGSEEGGKTSSGNTILGREAFALKKRAECTMYDGEVAGRQIRVIDTPGRKRDYLASFTSQLYKEEVVRSVALCPPGPHALLLVIKIITSFVDKCKEAIEEHLKLFGDTVWNHIIVLFTHGDKLDDMTIEQHLEEQGEPLQKLLEKCGNRYHVFNNIQRDNNNQVIQLFEKIEDMVKQNKGQHFEMDKNTLKGLEQNKIRQHDKAKQRRTSIPMDKLLPTVKNLRTVLLGCQFSGKSSAGNTILGEDFFSLKTIPTSVHKQATIAGRQMTIIDTPGWPKGGCFTNTPRKSKQEIVRSVFLCPPGPHAFLLVIPVDTTFTDADEQSIVDHLGLFGEEVWGYVILVFTYADWMGDTAIEMYIESEGEALQRLVDKCGNRYHALNNVDEDDGTQVRKLLKKIEHNIKVNKDNHFEMDTNGPGKELLEDTIEHNVVENGDNNFKMDGHDLDKIKHETLQEGVEDKVEVDDEEADGEENEQNGKYMCPDTSSGYGSSQHFSYMSFKSSISKEFNPPLMSNESDTNKYPEYGSG